MVCVSLYSPFTLKYSHMESWSNQFGFGLRILSSIFCIYWNTEVVMVFTGLNILTFEYVVRNRFPRKITSVYTQKFRVILSDNDKCFDHEKQQDLYRVIIFETKNHLKLQFQSEK